MDNWREKGCVAGGTTFFIITPSINKLLPQESGGYIVGTWFCLLCLSFPENVVLTQILRLWWALSHPYWPFLSGPVDGWPRSRLQPSLSQRICLSWSVGVISWGGIQSGRTKSLALGASPWTNLLLQDLWILRFAALAVCPSRRIFFKRHTHTHEHRTILSLICSSFI